MPRTSVLFVRASLLYLLAGFTLGGLLLADKTLLFWPGLFAWIPVHADLLLSGWLAQLAMGVTYWIVPRFSNRQSPRGNPLWITFSFWTFNAGVLLALFSPLQPTALGAGRGLQALGILLFIISIWRRIKPTGA
jgi:cbb3-type cytochrome oxidase subunit 1